MSIGSKIRTFRKNKGITLKQLSEMTGLSVGYLSNIERNINSPKLNKLQLICEALEINIVDLIKTSEHNNLVVRKDERPKIFEHHNENSNIKYEALTTGNKNPGGVCMILGKDITYENKSPWSHSFAELGFVIKGTLGIILEGKKYILEEGDTIYIPENTPHKQFNPGDEKCISYWSFNGDYTKEHL